MTDSAEERWKEAAGRLLELFRTAGGAAAFQYLDRLAADVGAVDPVGPPPGFREVARHLYWQHKALSESVAVWEETVRRLDDAVRHTTGPPDERLIVPLGGSCYNLASLAWPGWD